MKAEHFDIAILGSGFAGSLLAVIARKLGYTVALIEKGRHPRFAIGESSTPLTNLKLETLAARYDLPWLRSFAEYGSWKRDHADIPRGIKRGFSFACHGAGDEFRGDASHSHELLVASSPDEEHADTHWVRADFDHHMVRKAVEYGAYYLDECRVTQIDRGPPWRLRAEREAGEQTIEAAFLVDGTGEHALLRNTLGDEIKSMPVRTSSRGLFSHFEGMARWEDMLGELGVGTSDHPYPCDQAALHHVFHGGWMWVLPFDHGVTSAGFSLDPTHWPMDETVSAEDEWNAMMLRLPLVARQVVGAKKTRPLIRTGRLQRAVNKAAGVDWALLPHSACFVDPWLSPGIAHSLFSIERLARMLESRERRIPGWAHDYSERLIAEFHMADEITSTCFDCFARFPVMTTVTMLYFVAATFCEDALRANPANDVGFLLANDETYRETLFDLCKRARYCPARHADDFLRYAATRLAKYNRVGLCDPQRRNMYPFVSAAKEMST